MLLSVPYLSISFPCSRPRNVPTNLLTVTPQTEVSRTTAEVNQRRESLAHFWVWNIQTWVGYWMCIGLPLLDMPRMQCRHTLLSSATTKKEALQCFPLELVNFDLLLLLISYWYPINTIWAWPKLHANMCRIQCRSVTEKWGGRGKMEKNQNILLFFQN